MSVEALNEAPTVRGKTAGVAFHQVFAPRILAVVDPAAPAAAARRILHTVKEIHRSGGCGSYVYVDRDLQVFVISEERSVAQEWIKAHFDWLVGFYVTGRTRGPAIPHLHATVDGITEDIVGHMADLRRAEA